MIPNFRIVERFRPTKNMHNMSTSNIFKHMLIRKQIFSNHAKNFVLMVYYLFYRISIEIGISVMTRAEAIAFISINSLIVFSVINQVARFLYDGSKWIYCIISKIVWIYYNIESIEEKKRLTDKIGL